MEIVYQWEVAFMDGVKKHLNVIAVLLKMLHLGINMKEFIVTVLNVLKVVSMDSVQNLMFACK